MINLFILACIIIFFMYRWVNICIAEVDLAHDILEMRLKEINYGDQEGESRYQIMLQKEFKRNLMLICFWIDYKIPLNIIRNNIETMHYTKLRELNEKNKKKEGEKDV